MIKSMHTYGMMKSTLEACRYYRSKGICFKLAAAVPWLWTVLALSGVSVPQVAAAICLCIQNRLNAISPLWMTLLQITGNLNSCTMKEVI